MGIVWYREEHSKQYHHSEDGFQRGLYILVQALVEEGCLQLSQGAYAPFEFVLDNSILLFPFKAFVYVNT